MISKRLTGGRCAPTGHGVPCGPGRSGMQHVGLWAAQIAVSLCPCQAPTGPGYNKTLIGNGSVVC